MMLQYDNECLREMAYEQGHEDGLEEGKEEILKESLSLLRAGDMYGLIDYLTKEQENV